MQSKPDEKTGRAALADITLEKAKWTFETLLFPYGTDFTAVSGVKFADMVLIPTPRNPYEAQEKTEQTVLTLAYSGAEVLGHEVELSLYYHDESLIQLS